MHTMYCMAVTANLYADITNPNHTCRKSLLQTWNRVCVPTGLMGIPLLSFFSSILQCFSLPILYNTIFRHALESWTHLNLKLKGVSYSWVKYNGLKISITSYFLSSLFLLFLCLFDDDIIHLIIELLLLTSI